MPYDSAMPHHLELRGRESLVVSGVEDVERFDETWAPELDGTVMLGHGACLEDAEFVAGQLRERHPGIEIDIVYMGPIIGAHTGPGTVALLYWGSKR